MKELKDGLGVEFDKHDSDSLKKNMIELQNRLQSKNILVTLSELGAMSLHDGLFYHEKAHEREINDVSGAGDTVISVAALAMAVGCNSEDSMKLANLAGGLVCEKVGVVPIDKNRLLDEAIKYLS